MEKKAKNFEIVPVNLPGVYLGSYPSRVEVEKNQVERYNRDRLIEQRFDIENDTFKAGMQDCYPLDDESTKMIFFNSFYDYNDETLEL